MFNKLSFLYSKHLDKIYPLKPHRAVPTGRISQWENGDYYGGALMAYETTLNGLYCGVRVTFFLYCRNLRLVLALIATRAGWPGWKFLDRFLSLVQNWSFSWNANRKRRHHHRYLWLFDMTCCGLLGGWWVTTALANLRPLLSARQRTKHFSQVPKQ
jgi:hypothetical protein